MAEVKFQIRKAGKVAEKLEAAARKVHAQVGKAQIVPVAEVDALCDVRISGCRSTGHYCQLPDNPARRRVELVSFRRPDLLGSGVLAGDPLSVTG